MRISPVALLFLVSAVTFAEKTPPTAEQLRDSAVYLHDKEWLSHFPASFIASNLRGENLQYAERRQAALDLVREKRDFSVVSELMQDLKEHSFLGDQICELLGDWKARRAEPLLKEVAKDPKRTPSERDKAQKALKQFAVPDEQPPVYPSH